MNQYWYIIIIIIIFLNYLFIYLWLRWVFVSVRGLSPATASRGHSSSRCAGLSSLQPLLLQSTGSRRAGSVIVAHGPSRSTARGILPDQGLNLCPLHRQADSQPLRHQGSPREFLISLIVLFIIVCLLFSSYRSLFNVSCIFSILLPRFWIIFTIITLNSFSGRLSISSSFVWSGGFLPCSFIGCVFLCLLILLNLLCFESPFHRLQFHSSHCFWYLSQAAKVGSVGCVGFLVEGTSA